ncbi:HalOD1 output domain-containing protein [Halosimplex salinum]|uniref:HalOD1 output domain-containing protein n=1 Tax=Halosimplex salinum TaxID=1710538 RepID=UPI000F4AA74B|nr:HalOD1 output domain-containing protein [Halosimplex salinum]
MKDGKQGDDDVEEHTDRSEETVAFEHYDWENGDRPSIAVAEAVAAVTNRSVTALPPLQESVDADALDAVVRSGDEPAVRVSVEYAGTTVTVTGDGRLEIDTGAV